MEGEVVEVGNRGGKESNERGSREDEVVGIREDDHGRYKRRSSGGLGS